MMLFPLPPGEETEVLLESINVDYDFGTGTSLINRQRSKSVS